MCVDVSKDIHICVYLHAHMLICMSPHKHPCHTRLTNAPSNTPAYPLHGSTSTCAPHILRHKHTPLAHPTPNYLTETHLFTYINTCAHTHTPHTHIVSDPLVHSHNCPHSHIPHLHISYTHTTINMPPPQTHAHTDTTSHFTYTTSPAHIQSH